MKNLKIRYNGFSRSFIIEGDDMADVIVKSSLGAKCLYYLINNEGRSFKPIHLRAIIEDNVIISSDKMQFFNIVTIEDQILYQTLNQYIEASDMKAIIEIRKRIKKIDQELSEAQENYDLRKIDLLQNEKIELEDYVYDALNHNGTFRNINSVSRNATKSISRAIEAVLDTIAEQSELLYRYLLSHLIISTNQIKYCSNEESNY